MRSILYSIILHAVLVCIIWMEWPVKPQNALNECALVVDVVPIAELTNIKTRNAAPKKQPPPFVQNNIRQDNTQGDAITNTLHNAGETKINRDSAKQVLSAQFMTSTNIEQQPPPLPIPEKITKQVMEKVDKKSTIPKKPDKKSTMPKKAQTFAVQKKQDEYSKIVLKSIKSNKVHSHSPKEEAGKKELQPFDVIDDLLKEEINTEYNPSLEMTFSEIDAIKMQINAVWNTIAFSGSGNVMCVKLVLKVDKSGEVLSVRPILEHNNNPSYQAFVDSVIRAAYKASPFKGLPVEKYQYWQDMELTFSSDQMIY